LKERKFSGDDMKITTQRIGPKEPRKKGGSKLQAAHREVAEGGGWGGRITKKGKNDAQKGKKCWGK